jgi:thymidylate synthase (FAD)
MDNTVELIGIYGDDVTIAASAWTSTSRELTNEKIGRIPSLLKMLAENGHHTPFEKSTLHFLVVCDTASHIHLIKHRIGVSVNAESARYKELKDDKYYTPEDWPEDLKNGYEYNMAAFFALYHALVADLVKRGFDRKRAKESARFVLPYANQLTLDVSFNWRSFSHFLSLRRTRHAQKEIRDIANKMLDLVMQTHKFDATIEAFKAAGLLGEDDV